MKREFIETVLVSPKSTCCYGCHAPAIWRFKFTDGCVHLCSTHAREADAVEKLLKKLPDTQEGKE